MGMETVKLSKPWLDHAAKETVQVDPLRARWLRENGYAPPEVGVPGPFPGIEITPPVQVSDLPTPNTDVPAGHIVSRTKRKSLMKELSEPLTLDVDAEEP